MVTGYSAKLNTFAITSKTISAQAIEHFLRIHHVRGEVMKISFDNTTFEGLMLKAETMYQREAENCYYWKGYMRGLRRAHFGENIVPTEEHATLLNMANNTDECRQQIGKGYRDGLAALGKNAEKE